MTTATRRGPRLTNRYGLPEALVRAVANDSYDPGECDITATGLIKPPQMRALESRYIEQCSEDVTDRIYALFGQAIHHILDRAGDTSALTEERLFTHVCPNCDGEQSENPDCQQHTPWLISGQFDRCVVVPKTSGYSIEDYKVTGVMSVMLGEKVEWEQQLNIYAELLSRHGFHVTEAKVWAIFRDWMESRSRQEQDYPDVRVQAVPAVVWPKRQRVDYLRERVRMHQEVQQQADSELPECSPIERWAKPDQWAAYKEGNKRATKLEDTREAAIRFMAEKSMWNDETSRPAKGFKLVYRAGESTRCERYCLVADFCHQFQQVKKEAAA